jgi:tetraacyldisaccharide 4'-kinase
VTAVAWRYLLLPLGPVYRAVVAARSAAYRRGWMKKNRLELPVISVGNLTFGGTGKTPTVIALARDLVRMGKRPAVLTRGYKRLHDGQVVVVGPDPRQTAAEVGDEPLEMARRLPGVPVVVDADRARGGVEAKRLGADVVLLDDGFQHLQLERDLDLVLVDAGDPWGGGRQPPLGRLRESLGALTRADAVLITKVPSEWRPVVAEIERVVDRVAPRLQVFVSRMRPSRVRVPGEGWREPETLEGRRVFAFAALGRPDGFAATLVETGAEIAATRWFPDHHTYSEQELSEIADQAAAASAVPVTTAKDAVKLPPEAGAWVVEAVVEPIEGNWNGLWRLLPEVRS